MPGSEAKSAHGAGANPRARALRPARARPGARTAPRRSRRAAARRSRRSRARRQDRSASACDCKRAGLVEGDQGHVAQRLQRLALANSTPSSAARPVPAMIARRRESHSAGAGDDEHAHGIDQRKVRRGSGPISITPRRSAWRRPARPARRRP